MATSNREAKMDETIRKVGAGLLMWSPKTREVLLLQRRSQHNDFKWGLPGGNAEGDDPTPLDTAQREAIEELGHLPPYHVVLELLTKRGKDKQKHYRVFVCKVNEKDKAMYEPNLNEEHRDWKWIELAQLHNMIEELHPVVKKLVKEHNLLFKLS